MFPMLNSLITAKSQNTNNLNCSSFWEIKLNIWAPWTSILYNNDWLCKSCFPFMGQWLASSESLPRRLHTPHLTHLSDLPTTTGMWVCNPGLCVGLVTSQRTPYEQSVFSSLPQSRPWHGRDGELIFVDILLWKCYVSIFKAVTLFCRMLEWQIRDLTHLSDPTELHHTKNAL